MLGKIWKITVNTNVMSNITGLVTSDAVSAPVLVADMSTYPASTELRRLHQESKQHASWNNLNIEYKVFPNMFD